MIEAFSVIKGEEVAVFDVLDDRITLELLRSRLELPECEWEELDIHDVFVPVLESVVDELPCSNCP